MRYQTKLLITAGLLLALSLAAAALAYWGVSQSHSYLSRSRVAHQELERQLQLSRHSQQLFKSWTDTLLTGISDRPLGAAYLHKVIESDIAELERLTQEELAMIPPGERRTEFGGSRAPQRHQDGVPACARPARGRRAIAQPRAA